MTDMNLIENKWVDQNMNSWPSDAYSYEEVVLISQSLENCHNCFNCEDCKDCTYLIDCVQCIECHHSKQLSYRYGCENMVEHVVKSDHGASVLVSCVVSEADCCLENDGSTINQLLEELEHISYQALVNEVLAI